MILMGLSKAVSQLAASAVKHQPGGDTRSLGEMGHGAVDTLTQLVFFRQRLLSANVAARCEQCTDEGNVAAQRQPGTSMFLVQLRSG